MTTCFSRYKDTPKYITELARRNRENPTAQEKLLWNKLSGRKAEGLKFRRQFPIGRYITDFYNHANRLVLEIDGGIHRSSAEYDRNRDAYLNAGGYRVMRFTNIEIEKDIEKVIEKILENAPLRGVRGRTPGGYAQPTEII